MQDIHEESYRWHAKSYRWRRHLARAFGVRLTGDIPERLIATGLPIPLNAKRRDRLASIRAAGALFIHIPKNAGTSLATALYGHTMRHDTMRYYERVAPDVSALPSIAVIRDPVDRFLSAWCYARTGGTRHRQVSEPFREAYRGFRTIDDALDHLEGCGNPFAVDHIFRPQSWYITDRAGRIAITHLVPIDGLDRLPPLLATRNIAVLPRLNASTASDVAPTDMQRARIRHLYRDDVMLWNGLRAGSAISRPPLAVRTAKRG